MEEVFVKLTHSLTAWNLIAVSAKYRILCVRNAHFSNGIVLFSFHGIVQQKKSLFGIYE